MAVNGTLREVEWVQTLQNGQRRSVFARLRAAPHLAAAVRGRAAEPPHSAQLHLTERGPRALAQFEVTNDVQPTETICDIVLSVL